MTGPRIDMTVNLGIILQIFSVLVAIFLATNRLENRITSIEVKVDKMWSSWNGK